jgi:hypothetical protein
MRFVKSMRAIRTVSPCRHIQIRKELLLNILDQQVAIAKQLSSIDGDYTVEATHAWDVVEELSQKLHNINVQLSECIDEEDRYFDKMDREDRISRREYDL